MGMPLGPPSPVAPRFTDLTTTPTPAPSIGAGPDALRPVGSAYNLHAVMGGISTEEYKPPVWATQILTTDPTGSSAAQAQSVAQGYQRPGFPERISVNPFGTDPIGQFLGGDAGVAIGLVPGERQMVTGSGVATAPVTLANFSTWGRERVLALLTSAAGMDYQQPDGARFGDQPELVGSTATPGEAFVSGLAAAGDLVWKALEAPMAYMRNSDAFNRGKAVRNLFLQGDTKPYLIEWVSSAIFGGSERFTIEGLRGWAARNDVDVVDAAAKLYDLDPSIVAAIAANPHMGDDELGTYTDGSPWSVDPTVNLGRELAAQGALLAIGGAGVAKGAAALGRIGGAPGAFGLGLRGGQLAEGASLVSQAARSAGFLGRRALQLNSVNTRVGWTIGGAEWGIKQLAVIAGNEELVSAMDRLMRQMPLSMNPGWNLIDGFTSHPIAELRAWRRGVLPIGRRGSPGYVGDLDLRGMALRDGRTGEVMTVGGRPMSLRPTDSETAVLGRLRDLTPDDMHAQFFRNLGWSREAMEQAFGEGNRGGLTWDDARNALFTVALSAAREAKGQVGRLEGLELPTMAMRSEAFVRNNAAAAMRILDDTLRGRSTAMLDQFRGSFWDLAARNDSSVAEIKAHLGGYDPATALGDFVSWVRASKVVHEAMRRGVAGQMAVPVLRRTVNRDFVARWLEDITRRYAADEEVPASVINQLKRFGGAVESRGRGAQLIRGPRVTRFTRRQMEEIVADVLRADDEWMRRANSVPREEASAYRRGVDPGQDPLEDARVGGISPTMLDAIRREQARPTHAALPPERLLQTIAADTGRTVDGLRRLGPDGAWQAAFEWLDNRLATATETAAIRDALDDMAAALTARVADGRMTAQQAGPAVAALGRIRDEILTPLDPKVARNRSGLYAKWQETALEAGVLAQEMARHLADPAGAWRSVEVAPGQWHVLPATISGELLKRYQAIIARALRKADPGISDFDRQRLADPAIHPFLKGDILATLTDPRDRAALLEVQKAIGGDPRDVLAGMAGDAGIDAGDPAAVAAMLDQRAQAHVQAGLELGGRAEQLARRFQTLGGAYSDEMADTIDRVLAYSPEVRKRTRRGITALPMDPEEGARRTATRATMQRAKAQRDLTAAQQRLDAAERALAGQGARESAFDPETMVWEGSARYSSGKDATRRRQALAEKRRIERTTGDLVQVVREEDGAYRVLVARPRGPEVPPYVPPAELRPYDTLESVTSLVDGLLASDRIGANDALADLRMALPENLVADPRYAPDQIGPVIDHVRAVSERLTRDLERNPAVGSIDVRQDALGWAAPVLEAYDRRLAAMAPEVVPEAPVVVESRGAPSTYRPFDRDAFHRGEPQQNPEGTWMSYRTGGETFPSREALEAKIAGQEAQQTRAPAPAEPTEPIVPDGAFPDPDTGAPVAYQTTVVDATGLITSSDNGFDAELQPRMRGVRQASDEQIASIASGPDPARLLGSETGAQGSPVVLPDRQVLAGNGRVTGIRQAYADGRADAYRAAVVSEAERLGLSTEGMEHPVLVRVIDVPRAEAIRLAVHLNFETGMPLADQAVGLSRLISAEDIGKLRIGASQSLEDALASSANDDFVQAFLGHVPQQFRGTLKEIDGSLNQQGQQLMAATLLARFTNASESPGGQQLIATLFEGDPEVRSLASGMDAIGALIQAQVESVDRPWGGVAPAFAADLVPALQRVFDLQAQMQSLRDVEATLMSAGTLFDDVPDLTPTQQALARNLALMAQQNIPGGGAAGLRQLLRNVARRIRGHDEAGVEAQPMDLFGAESDVAFAPSYPAVVNEALTAMNLRRPEGRQFQLLPDMSGVTVVRDLSGAETARLHPVVDEPAAVIESLAPTLGDVVLEGNDWGALAAQAARSTGRVVLRVDTEAEATALRAFLAGDDAAALPRDYRVVDGEIQPIGNIRGEIVERIYGRYRSEASARAGARYLTWLLTHEGAEPPTPANVRKFVDSELAYRQGPRPIPPNADLPALRDALAGRDFEVQVGRPLVEIASDAPARPTGYFNGDQFEYLGTSQEIHGGTFYDVLMLEGKDAGTQKVVRQPPPSTTATEIVAAAARDIDPDFERVTGLSPVRADLDSDATAAAASGAHRLVISSDEVREAAAQRAAGAPVIRGRQVIESNPLTGAERLRLAQQARDAAALEVEGARTRLDELGPDTSGPPPREVLSGSELDLYHRYIDSSTSPGNPRRQPADVGEVLDLLASLDLGLPPLVGTMTELEMEALRTALLRVLHARLDELGIAPGTGPARRAGKGGRRHRREEPRVGTTVREEPRVTTPEDLSEDLAEVVRTLQSRVYEADDALAGWEGTQYEIGMPPARSTDETGPLAPRIPAGEDWINRMEELVPGLGEELLHGRKRAWTERVDDARWSQSMEHVPAGWMVTRMRTMLDTAFGPRPERAIVSQAIGRFEADLLRHFDGDADELKAAQAKVHEMIGAVHDRMAKVKMPYIGMQLYRRVGLVDAGSFEEAAMSVFGVERPEWLARFLADRQAQGIRHPLADAWRHADNRIRAYFAERPGGISQFLDTIYDSRGGARRSAIGRGITVFYHTARFLMDLRWLGLELIEAPTLVLFREGPGAMLEGLGKGRNAGRRPMFMGVAGPEQMRDSWAWWLAQSDPGGYLRTRERFVLAQVRRVQEQEFPRVLRQAAQDSPDLAAAIRAFDGGDEMAWLRRLDADLELASRRGQQLEPADAERLFRPWLERGVISKTEYAQFMASRRYTGHPALDRALAETVGEPWMQPLIERLQAINEQGWGDAAKLIFGQTDRSNVQRLMNHPLLWWPISYQIKATKWLAGLLFDRAFGIDTGSLGAVTLGQIHQMHMDRMRDDPEYARKVSENPTLLFVAQMLFPITPWDLGVSLSPFTRLAISMATSPEDEGYRRNVFSVGPGYTYYSMLPRLFREQSQPGSWAQQTGGITGDVFRAGQRFAPYTIPIAPTTSELGSVEQQVGRGGIPDTTPPEQPAYRYP